MCICTAGNLSLIFYTANKMHWPIIPQRQYHTFQILNVTSKRGRCMCEVSVSLTDKTIQQQQKKPEMCRCRLIRIRSVKHGVCVCMQINRMPKNTRNNKTKRKTKKQKRI